jgi:hypothetical protein
MMLVVVIDELDFLPQLQDSVAHAEESMLLRKSSRP